MKPGVLDLIRRKPSMVFGLAGMVFKEIANTPRLASERRRILKRGQRAIGYVGWIGHENLGDEAVFEAIRDSLPVDEPVIQFIAAEGETLLRRLGVGGHDLFRAVFLGGGTLIHPYYLPVGQFVKKSGIPMYTVGTGVGSPGFNAPQRLSLDGWKEVLQDCELLSVRGPISYERLQNLGLRQTEIIGDPALGLAPDAAPPFRSRQRLILSLVLEEQPARNSDEYAMLRQVAVIANDFADKGGEVVGVALGGDDRGALERFAEEHDVPKLRIEDHRTSTRRFFETVTGSMGLIGIRLHSAVLAACVGVPPILFAYRDKCHDFMNSMDLGEFAIRISRDRGPRQIAERFEQLRSDTTLGPAIYARAVYWKMQQRDFYTRLAKSIRGL